MDPMTKPTGVGRGGSRAGAGRPRTTDPRGHLHIRTMPGQLERWTAAATASGARDVSTWIREKIDAVADRELSKAERVITAAVLGEGEKRR